MSNWFDPDRPLLAFITKMAYSAYLNILWLICSLPIVTAGASTTALFYVTLKMAEDRDEGLTGMFFRAFRQNFKPATKLWLILLGAGVFLALDGYIVWHLWSHRGRAGLRHRFDVRLPAAGPVREYHLRHPQDLAAGGAAVYGLYPGDGGNLLPDGMDCGLSVYPSLSFGVRLLRHALLLSAGEYRPCLRRRPRQTAGRRASRA